MEKNFEIERPVGADIMTQWDSLEKQISILKERQDIRLFVLLQDFEKWQKNQGIDWLAKPDRWYPISYVYLSTDEQNRNVQLVLTFPERIRSDFEWTAYFTVTEQLVCEQNPNNVAGEIDWEATEDARGSIQRQYDRRMQNSVGREGEEEISQLQQDVDREVHRLKWGNIIGTVFYRYPLSNIQHGNHKTQSRNLVVYRANEDPKVDLNDPDTICTGYGRTNRIEESWRGAMGGKVEYRFLPQEIVRKWHEDPAKHIDPIDAGKRTLGLLQKAKLVGRFDTRTGRIIQPTWLPIELEG